MNSQLDEPKKYPVRTGQQNRALHVLFRLVAETLNEHGLDMRKALKPEIDIPWTDKAVKEFLWRPVQKAQLNKQSTTELTTVEIDQVFDTLNKYFGERFGLHVPFPSIDGILLQMEAEAREKRGEK